MNSISVNTYHPFANSSIGLSFSSNITNQKYSHNLIKNLDLYHQPLDPPSIATSMFFVRFTCCILGELVMCKLFKMVRKEKGLVNDVTQFYCIVMITTCPSWHLFVTMTDFLYPLKDIMGQWICSLMRIVFYMNFNVVIFHSFFVAFMRYFFIVHEEKVQNFGKQKTKNIFLFLIIFVPILLIAWGFIENQAFGFNIWLNRCYAVDHKVFLAELTTGKNLFCIFQTIDGRYGYILSVVRHITCITKVVIVMLVGMNVTEGFLYYKIFSHISRFDSYHFFYVCILTLYEIRLKKYVFVSLMFFLSLQRT